MAITEPFDTYPEKYEQWFSAFRAVYDTEINALRDALPVSAEDRQQLKGVEIGAGSGLFASRLGIQYGVEPSLPMLEKAKERGIKMKHGCAEKLPLGENSFDLALMVTAVCFLENPGQALSEIRRILKPGGCALFGMIDRDSPLGRLYRKHKDEDIFYRRARFRSSTEIVSLLQQEGFIVDITRQTVFGPLEDITHPQEWKEGLGEGGFAIIRGRSWNRDS